MNYQLIQQAKRVSCFNWDLINSLIAQTNEPDTISQLERIRMNKYLQEERMV